jgi:hypothetical protein
MSRRLTAAVGWWTEIRPFALVLVAPDVGDEQRECEYLDDFL